MNGEHDTAIIKQLMPMADKWEFQFMFNNHRGDPSGITLHRQPMLGLALIEYPFGRNEEETEFEQRVVRFGEGWGGMTEFTLYCERAWGTTRFLYPFFQNDPQTRALGFAPVDSPDDFFGAEVAEAVEQLEAEQLYGNDLRRLHAAYQKCAQNGNKNSYDYDHWMFTKALNDYFYAETKRARNDAGKDDWAKVSAALKSLSNDKAMVNAVLNARKE
jgi:hypothetical protein